MELIFYNGCDNRWQMYQLDDSTDQTKLDPTVEEYFKVHISNLLATCQNALKQHFPQSPVDQTGTVRLHLGRSSQRVKFAKYCSSKLHEDSDSKALVPFLQKLAAGETVDIPAKSISKLLATLPIRREWDIFGQLHPMSTSSTRNGADSTWWEGFFVYELEFTGDSDSDTHLRQTFLRVRITDDCTDPPPGQQAVFKHKLDRVVKERMDYYAFARHPDMMGKAERDLYHQYANIIDPVQQIKQKRSYYAVWPVIACGYLHFLQLKLIRPEGVPEETASCHCYGEIANKIVPRAKPYFILKESIRELLVQIRLSAFQQQVTRWIRDNASRILLSQHGAEDAAAECFCTLAPLINEMRAVIWNGRTWAHVSRSSQTPPEVDQILNAWREADPDRVGRDESGVVWIDVEVPGENGDEHVRLNRHDYVCVTLQNPKSPIDLWLFHREGTTPFNCACFEGTNMGRLSEQYQVVRQRVRRLWVSERGLGSLA